MGQNYRWRQIFRRMNKNSNPDQPKNVHDTRNKDINKRDLTSNIC